MSETGRTAEQFFQAALTRHRAGDLAGAEGGYRQAIASAPEHGWAHQNLAVLLHTLKRPAEALAYADVAAALLPDKAATHVTRALILRRLGRREDALTSVERAVTLQPDDAGLHVHRAQLLFELHQPEAALDAFDLALKLGPGLAEAHNGRGSALVRLERLEEGLAAYDRAIALAPNLMTAHRNRGVALRRLRRPDDAIRAQDRAIALTPDQSDAYWYRGLSHLLLGQFKTGWRDYARRWDVEEFRREASGAMTDALRARLVPGLRREDLAGRDVLLVGEQGVGDVVMFASAIPDLLAVAGRVAVTCDPRLERLFAASFPAVEFLDSAAAAERRDASAVVLGIGSLGGLFRNRPEDFPGEPYLAPRPETVARWAARLGPAQGRRRIGVSWRGGLVRTGQAARSLDLAQLRPVLDLPDCEIVSLQYGDPSAEVAAFNAHRAAPIRLFPPAEIDDFDDLAGLIANLDLVVSVQTALVHLTGALGVPGLVMVPATPEWRYGTEGSTMPWYRSIRLFRKDPDAAWEPLVDAVAADAARRLTAA